MLGFFFIHLLQTLLIGLIIYCLGLTSLAIHDKNNPVRTTGILLRGSFILISLLAIIYTSGKTIFIGVPIIIIFYYFLNKNTFSDAKPAPFILKKHLKNFGLFSVFILISSLVTGIYITHLHGFNIANTPSFYDLYHYHGVATKIIDQHAETSFYYWNQLPNIGVYAYHYFDIWLDVFCMLLFKNASFNIFQFVVIPFLTAALIQGVYDHLSKYLSSTTVLIILSLALTILCTQSFFNDSFFLSYIPTSRSYFPFSPTGYKLLIVYLLILQTIHEVQSNPKSLPLSLLLLSITYLTTLPLLILILGFHTFYHNFRAHRRRFFLDMLMLGVVFGIFITLLLSNTSEDMKSHAGASIIENFQLIAALKFAGISWIQSFAQLWLVFILSGVLIYKIGFRQFFQQYSFYSYSFAICFLVGAGVFPYLKKFGFDNDQFYYNLIMPLSFCLNVFFISEILKHQLHKNYLFIVSLVVSLFLSSKQLFATWTYYRPLACNENVDNDFISAINKRLNQNSKTNRGISICKQDTTHFAYHNSKEDFIVIGNNWSMCYLNNYVYPTNFSKFYFKENGLSLMANKTYINKYLEKKYADSNVKLSKNKIIGDFVKDNNISYLLSDFALPIEITQHFADTILCKVSTLRVYVK
jgi:hypothetical protein